MLKQTNIDIFNFSLTQINLRSNFEVIPQNLVLRCMVLRRILIYRNQPILKYIDQLERHGFFLEPSHLSITFLGNRTTSQKGRCHAVLFRDLLKFGLPLTADSNGSSNRYHFFLFSFVFSTIIIYIERICTVARRYKFYFLVAKTTFQTNERSN